MIDLRYLWDVPGQSKVTHYGVFRLYLDIVEPCNQIELRCPLTQSAGLKMPPSERTHISEHVIFCRGCRGKSHLVCIQGLLRSLYTNFSVPGILLCGNVGLD